MYHPTCLRGFLSFLLITVTINQSIASVNLLAQAARLLKIHHRKRPTAYGNLSRGSDSPRSVQSLEPVSPEYFATLSRRQGLNRTSPEPSPRRFPARSSQEGHAIGESGGLAPEFARALRPAGFPPEFASALRPADMDHWNMLDKAHKELERLAQGAENPMIQRMSFGGEPAQSSALSALEDEAKIRERLAEELGNIPPIVLRQCEKFWEKMKYNKVIDVEVSVRVPSKRTRWCQGEIVGVVSWANTILLTVEYEWPEDHEIYMQDFGFHEMRPAGVWDLNHLGRVFTSIFSPDAADPTVFDLEAWLTLEQPGQPDLGEFWVIVREPRGSMKWSDMVMMCLFSDDLASAPKEKYRPLSMSDLPPQLQQGNVAYYHQDIFEERLALRSREEDIDEAQFLAKLDKLKDQERNRIRHREPIKWDEFADGSRRGRGLYSGKTYIQNQKSG